MAREFTAEQKARIEQNRRKALERRNQRNQSGGAPLVTSKFVEVENGQIKRPKVALTPEQQERIERNRQRALEIRRKLAGSNPQATPNAENRMTRPDDNIRLNKNQHDLVETKPSKFMPPPIKRADYIEYDFATMADSKGGFIGTEEQSEGDGSLKDWQEKQRARPFHDAPPPTDPATAPKCYECQSIEIDQQLYQKFNQVRVCKQCKRDKPEKYSLLTKTECREDYFLTEPELQDVNILPRVEKPNPHGFSRMQLFLRFQVEEYAWKKWGGPEGLDAEWEKREGAKLKRKEKRYAAELKEMRKKTRAEEYTRKLRNGEGLVEKHVHDWSAPLVMDNQPSERPMVKRRCIDCGMETTEILI
ncbi:DNA repair protein Rad14p [Diutina catenulata]